ncbi:MAG TPA: SRPBCC domain-containing protein [Actinomycetota bacterium]
MVLEVPDELTRELTIEAPRERVWAALTEPALLLRWFPTHVAEVDPRVGGAMRFGWEDDGDEAVIDAIEPPARLRFRWRPAGSERPYTEVTFTLEADGDATRLTLVERGFASLPDQIHQQSYEGNLRGWGEELEELRVFLEEGGA